jgi:hypothetical protein
MRRIFVALVHYPILSGEGAVITTAVTSVDVHDIARSCRTFGVERYYLVHPVEASRRLVDDIKQGWLKRPDSPKNRARREALSRLFVVPSIEAITSDLGEVPEIWSTSANPQTSALLYSEAKDACARTGPPVLLLFGTGNGLAPSVASLCQRALEPIVSQEASGYNHLSVRAAVAIALDRLFGTTR